MIRLSLNKKEFIILYLKTLFLSVLLTYFFYRSAAAFPFMALIALYEMKEDKKRMMERKKNELIQQWKEALFIISANLRSGYSIQNSFKEAKTDLIRLYGEKSMIVRIFETIGYGLGNNIALEKQITEIGIKSGMDDIAEFGDILFLLIRNGGNITLALEKTALAIHEKLETEHEISVLLSARKFEQRIMNGIPFFILLYMEITSPGYFNLLYHNRLGVIIMSICLILYLSAYYLSEKIMRIRV